MHDVLKVPFTLCAAQLFIGGQSGSMNEGGRRREFPSFRTVTWVQERRGKLFLRDILDCFSPISVRRERIIVLGEQTSVTENTCGCDILGYSAGGWAGIFVTWMRQPHSISLRFGIPSQ
jgi:hypothetical protein